jgi:hypothetical protein
VGTIWARLPFPAASPLEIGVGHLPVALAGGVVLMGNIAIRTQQKLLWDAENPRFTNSEAANQLLNPPYRERWTL